MNRRVEFFISDVASATKIAIEQIKFNPCYLDADPASNSKCAQGSTRIPVLPSSGEGQPLGVLDLSRSAVPSRTNVSRPVLPSDPLERPSIKELQQ